MIGQDAVMLFWHTTVTTAQSGLNMDQCDPGVMRRQCPCQRTICIAIYQYSPWLYLLNLLGDTPHHIGQTHASALLGWVDHCIWRWDI